MWAHVERILGRRITADERTLCLTGADLDWDYLRSRDDQGVAREVAEDAVAYLNPIRPLLRKTAEFDLPNHDEPARGPQWELLADLDSVARKGTQLGDAPRWAPVRVSADFAVGAGTYGDIGSPARQVEVTVTFDARMSQRALLAELKDLWQTMTEARMVRRMRRLGPTAVNLVRHVCLDREPEDGWMGHFAAWNERYPSRAFRNSSDFQRDFHAAEQQLVGRRWGLEQFYDPLAQLSETELDQLVVSGNRRARNRRVRLESLQAKRRGFADPSEDVGKAPLWLDDLNLRVTRHGSV